MAEKKRPGQKFKMLSVDEILGVNNEESAIDLKISEIVPFKDHPFRVTDDEKMEELVKSIRMNGILTPVLVRPTSDGKYEMISGHRRMHAATLAGLLGIAVTGLCATAVMCSAKSFGMPFFAPFSPVTKHTSHLLFRTRIKNRAEASDPSNPKRRRV